MFSCRRGATTIEYGLIASLIAVAIMGAIWTLRGGLQKTYRTISWGFEWNPEMAAHLMNNFHSYKGGDDLLSRSEALTMYIDNGAPNPYHARDKTFFNFDDNDDDKMTESEFQDLVDYVADPTTGGFATLKRF